MIVETETLIKIIPSEGNHIKRISTGEIYPSYIYPASGIPIEDFMEVTEEEYQEYLLNIERLAEQEYLESISANE